jgi:tripartite-type tricarboxylate transporter receptor subunit TctC
MIRHGCPRIRGPLPVALLALAMLAQPAAAQGFPARPVRLLVGISAGSGVDVAARLVAQRLSERWGQQVVVDNRPGAGSLIAMEIAAKASPDGHTLIVNNNSQVISPSLYRKIPFDAVRDFIAVAPLAVSPQILVAGPASPIASVPQLIEAARAQPDRITLASAGSGSPSHLAGELFKSMAGVKLVHVPYKGGPQALNDVIAGTVALYVSGMPPAVPLIKAARLKALAVTSPKRAAGFPQIPTFAEAGLTGYEADLWYGMFAPAGLPPAVLAALNAAVAEALRHPETRERFAGLGIEPTIADAAGFAAFVRAEAAKWERVIRDARITAD